MKDQRRAGDDEDVTFIRTVRATDEGVSMAWRWAQIIVTLIAFGVTIGTMLAKSASTEYAISELRSDVAEFRKTYSDLNLQTDRNTRDLGSMRAELQALRDENRELRDQLNTLRNMREAYVYDSAKAARNKLLQSATTPP